MKNLRKFVLIALAAAFVVPVLDSCKKGEEDPALSLKSRKGRLKGEWKVDSYEVNEVDESSNTSVSGITTTTKDESKSVYDGTKVTTTGKTTYTSGGTTTTDTWDVETENFAATYTIEGDGTFSKEETTSYTETDVDTFGSRIRTSVIEVSEVTSVSGTWDFNEGVGEFASKEKVLFFYDEGKTTTTTTVTETYTDIGGGNTETNKSVNTHTLNFTYTNISEEVWLLTMLKNKEMKVNLAVGFTGDETSKSDYTPHGGATTSTTTTSSYTFSAEGSAMLSKQ